MANKRRPKKTKAPYRKYVGGVGYVSSQTVVKEINPNYNYFTKSDTEDGYDEDDYDENGESTTSSISSISSISTSSSSYSVYETDRSESFMSGGSRKYRKSSDKINGGSSGDRNVDQQRHRQSYGTGVFPNEIYLKIIEIVILLDNGYCADDGEEEQRPEGTIDTRALWVDPKYLYVSHNWYRMMIPLLYMAPKLVSKNFVSFMDTLDADKKLKRHNKTAVKLSELVKTLDLSMIIQSGKNSFISKLLRRCSATLTEFIAPQTSFGYAPLISLKSCANLEILNLGLVSETVELDQLFMAIKNFKKLTHVSFPRSSINCDVCLDTLVSRLNNMDLVSNGGGSESHNLQHVNEVSSSLWPLSVQHLRLSGGLTNDFARKCPLPCNLKSLELAHCPLLDTGSIYKILENCGQSLETLMFRYPMPGLHEESLDNIFRYTGGNLRILQIVADYTSKWLFQDDYNMSMNLEVLYLECSGSLGQMFKIHPDDLTVAIMENRLPSLRKIYVSCKIGWDMNSDDVDDLINVLEDQGGKLYVTY